MKIVYCLVVRENPIFDDMVFLSISTLKRHNPGAEVVCLVDLETDKRHAVSPLRSFAIADQWIVVNTHINDPVISSRYLKVNSRLLIQGTFLYIDADTLVMDSIAPVWEIPGDFIIARDQQSMAKLKRRFPQQLPNITWNWPENLKFWNGGVWLMRDLPQTHTLANTWMTCYQESCAQGVILDQPALAYTIYQLGQQVKVSELPSAYNMMDGDFGWRLNGRILHFWSFRITSNRGNQKNYLLRHLVDILQRENYIDWEAINQAKARGNDMFMGKRPGVKENLRLGRYGDALDSLGRKLFSLKTIKRQ